MSKSPSLRRIQADVRELAFDPSDRYHAAPMENDMFEWHFTIRGADGTDFEGGMYHGRILLPPEYPMRPPNIVFLTPSGRFETNTKICLSFSAFHPELWQPAWGIRLILEALISFLPTPADGAIGALDWSSAERRKLAAQSVHHECPICGKIANLLPEIKKGTDNDEEISKKPSRFQREIEELQRAQQMQHALINDKEEIRRDLCQEINCEESIPLENKPQQNDGSMNDDKNNKHQDCERELKVDEEVEITFSPVKHEKPDHKVATSSSVQQPDDVQDLTGNEAEPTPTQSTGPVMSDQQQHEQQNLQVDLSSSWLLSDPVLHTIMLVLSVTCYLLLRKIDAVMEEIYALENE